MNAPRIGVVGRGKTGSKVVEVLGQDSSRVFSRSHPLSFKETQSLDALIVFVPAEGLKEILPQLIECGRPVVCGTTGFTWPANLASQLIEKKLTWITGTNFSPGMNFLFTVAKLVESNREFLGLPTLRIHEIHHTEKKDSPSGSALTLQTLTGGRTEVHAERIGDHPGYHELDVASAFESLHLQHEAHDRKAFAEGAVYAARVLLPKLAPGLYSFENLMRDKILNAVKKDNL